MEDPVKLYTVYRVTVAICQGPGDVRGHPVDTDYFASQHSLDTLDGRPVLLS